MGKVTPIGSVGSEQLATLTNQAIVGITIGAVRKTIGGGFAQSHIFDLHGEHMLERNGTRAVVARSN